MACIQKKKGDFNLVKLPPNSYTFKVDNKANRIDYFYVAGRFSYNLEDYKKLQNMINEKSKELSLNDYKFCSVYIYNKTDTLNDSYSNGKEGLDGHNKDLIAFIRYDNGKQDIFYILKDGNVIYDLQTGKESDFEFDQ